MKKLPKEYTVICNTRCGYCMTPYKCQFINQAIKYAKDMGMAYRVFMHGKCVRSGW